MPKKRRPDPLSLTLALVEAYSIDNDQFVAKARNNLSVVGTGDILVSLLWFGALLDRAKSNDEQLAIISGELEVAGPNPEFTNAVRELGRAIFIERKQDALITAIKNYMPPLAKQSSDESRRVALTLAFIAGSISRQLGVKFNWS